MTSVIAVLGAPPEQYPLWQWLPGVHLRLILDEPPTPALGIPAEHVVVGGHQRRSASLGALIEQMCAQRLPDRIVHLQAADAQRVAAARTLHGLDGQQLTFAALVADRVGIRESLRGAGIPLTAYTPITRPADLRAFADTHGFPIRVGTRFAQATWPEVLLTSAGEMNSWIAHGYHDAPEGWIAEPAAHGPYLRIDALCRDLPPELVWVAEHEPSDSAHLTVALAPHDPRAQDARALLAAVLAVLPHPAVGLVHAVLRPGERGLELADFDTGIDPAFPRSLMTDSLGVDPVRRYVQAAAGLLLPPAADRLQRLSGRIAIPTRRPPAGLPPLPERFAAAGSRAHLPEPRPRRPRRSLVRNHRPGPRRGTARPARIRRLVRRCRAPPTTGQRRLTAREAPLLTPASREVALERINDLLRQAERHRLIKTALRARKERRRAQRHQRREARAAARRLTNAPAPADPSPVPAQESS